MTKKLVVVGKEFGVGAIHALAHSTEFWAALKAAKILGVPYALTCHDDVAYVLSYNPLRALALKRLGTAWREAHVRFVISSALGQEYCRRYGSRQFQVVTHGLATVQAQARRAVPGRLCVYFSGSIHNSYAANFRSLVQALELLRRSRPDLEVSLLGRGSPPPGELPPWVGFKEFKSEQHQSEDLNEADVMYLPLPFGRRQAPFCRFSLPTKLIAYLGAGLPILCHAPDYSGASKILNNRGAGIIVSDLNPLVLAQGLLLALRNRESLATSSLRLAREEFLLANTKLIFWTALQEIQASPSQNTVIC
ncbi:MAG: hypothetical protein ACR2FO_00735 [Actinomycetota bacterium]